MNDEEKECNHCSRCDYCYTNETMNNSYLCVNGNSEYFAEFVGDIDEACQEYINKYSI